MNGAHDKMAFASALKDLALITMSYLHVDNYKTGLLIGRTQLDKIKRVRENLTHLETIVIIEPDVDDLGERPGVADRRAFVQAMAAGFSAEQVQDALRGQAEARAKAAQREVVEALKRETSTVSGPS